MAWAQEQQGLAETTLGTYATAIIPFVGALGEDPAAYDAAAIRGYMLGRAGAVSAPASRASALRSARSSAS